MSKTVFLTKCMILGDLWLNFREEIKDIQDWKDFFDWADIGLPIAYLHAENYVKSTASGNEIVQETWEVFCNMLGIDVDGKWSTLEECFDASPYNKNDDSEDEGSAEA